MNINDFAYTHDQQVGTVAMYIRWHKDLFKEKQGGYGINLSIKINLKNNTFKKFTNKYYDKIKDHSATLIDFGKAFSYKKHNINIKKDVDLSGIKELIEFLIVHSNYQKLNNDAELTSLCELNTFDEFYNSLCKL